jgi:hypothetical protein
VLAREADVAVAVPFALSVQFGDVAGSVHVDQFLELARRPGVGHVDPRHRD